MNYDSIFAEHANKTVRAGLIGAGQFGASFVGQVVRTPILDIPVVCDLDAERAAAVFIAAGYAAEDVVIAESIPVALMALESGKRVAVGDAGIVPQLPLDIIVEATGNPEAAAVIGVAALDEGKHLAMVTKEADSVIGPYLAARAKRAGLVATPVDGDQPSLLIGLLSWAKLLGLEVVSAGKSSEYDFIYDRVHGTVSWRGEAIAVPDFADVWLMPELRVTETVDVRSEMLRMFPQRTVPDLCEMGVVCNHTGLRPDNPSFHAPHARTLEVPEVLRPKDAGGILSAPGTIDVFNCLRRADEQSFAGGVFIVVDCTDRETWQVLSEKGIPVSRNGGHGMLYNPSHLLGVEAPVSILSACLLGRGTGAAEVRHTVDLVAQTARNWKAGQVLTITDHHHHEVAGLEPLLLSAAPATATNPLPYYMAVGGTLALDVPAGTVLTRAMVEAPKESALWKLRDEMDAAAQ